MGLYRKLRLEVLMNFPIIFISCLPLFLGMANLFCAFTYERVDSFVIGFLLVLPYIGILLYKLFHNVFMLCCGIAVLVALIGALYYICINIGPMLAAPVSGMSLLILWIILSLTGKITVKIDK